MNEPSAPPGALHAHRYAVYFAPRLQSAWWQAGSCWLGRCAARGELLPQPALPGLSREEQAHVTSAPRRYGWHGTLRPPFSLAPGVLLHQLQSRLHALSIVLQPFDMPRMKVARLGNFLALVPVHHCTAIDEAAKACLVELHDLAAPPGPEDLERRRTVKLSPEEEALLVQWGYPFVMHRFRFHMSLTGRLDGVAPTAVRRLEEAAGTWFDRLPPLVFGSLTLFAEPTPGSDFIVLEQIDLHGRPSMRAPPLS